MSDERFERINTYHYFWNLKTMIYSIEGKALPVPIGGPFIFYYGVILVLVIILAKIPLINLIFTLPYIKEPFLMYGGLPLTAAYFLDHVKLDGKSPHIYLLDMARFLINPKVYEHFREIKIEKSKKVKHIIKYRVEEIISIMLKEKVDKKKYRHMHEYL